MRKAFALALLFSLLLSQAVAAAALCKCLAEKPACHCSDGNGCCGKAPKPCDASTGDAHPEAILVAAQLAFGDVQLIATVHLDAEMPLDFQIAKVVQKHPPRIRTPDIGYEPLRGPPSFA